MAIPRAPEARVFYRSALQRLDDAEYLLNGNKGTAAVYLGGYTVECILKALILNAVEPRRRKQIIESFRGSKAHRFAWLLKIYRELGGPLPPQIIREKFANISTWSTDLRYQPGEVNPRDAVKFLAAVNEIITWADGRM